MTTFLKLRIRGAIVLSLTLAACSGGGGGGTPPPPGSLGAASPRCRPGVDCPGEDQSVVRTGRPAVTAPAVGGSGERRAGGTETTVAPAPALIGVTAGGGGGALLGANNYSGGPGAGSGNLPPRYESYGGAGGMGGPPRSGLPASTTWTGGDDGRGRRFMDAFDDQVMQLLKGQMNLLGGGKYQKDSADFANDIKDLDVWVGRNGTREIDNRPVRMKVAIHVGADSNYSGYTGVLVAILAGQITCRGRQCMAELRQTNLTEGVRMKGGFHADVMCVDMGQSCQHKIVKIEQLDEGGTPCKTAFAVHRYGDALMVGDNNFLVAADHPGTNPNAAEIGKYFYNSNMCVMQHSSNAAERKIGRCDQYPRAHSLGLKTWAVAGGFGAFEIMLSGTPSPEEQNTRDVMILRGPSVAVGGGWVYGPEQDYLAIVGFRKNIHNDNDPMNWNATQADGFASKISNARLLSNNGRGRIEVRMVFGDDASFVFRVESLAFSTMPLDMIRSLFPKRAGGPVRCEMSAISQLSIVEIHNHDCCKEFYSNPDQFQDRKQVCCYKDNNEHGACSTESIPQGS